MRNIDLVRQVISAPENNWPHVPDYLNVNIPDSPRHHVPYSACGDKDRFRFDGNGHGSFICNRCGVGNGPDLIRRINNHDTTKAALLIVDVPGIDCRTTEIPEATSQKRERLEVEYQQREQEHLRGTERDEQQRRDMFSRQFDDMYRKAVDDESDYLVAKRVGDFTLPVLSDGPLLLALVDKSDAVAVAQTIISYGEKRLLIGSVERGTYHTIGVPETTQGISTVEGLVAALSVRLACPEALAVVAIDAENLLYVAQVPRDKFPSVRIIVVADNDHSEGRQDTGKIVAERVALSVSGQVTLPPTDRKVDQSDYHQKHGIKYVTKVFNKSVYQPQGNDMKQEPQTIEGNDSKVMDIDLLKPRIESHKGGIYWVPPRVDSQSGEAISSKSQLCSPLSVIGTGRDDKDQYPILCWLSSGPGMSTAAAVLLANTGERKRWRILKTSGVSVTIESSPRVVLADWLQYGGLRESWRVAHAIGWQCGAYTMPDGRIIGIPENPVLFNGRSSAAAGHTVLGSVKSWYGNVARLVSGNHSMVTGTGAALTAPLIGLVGADGFGIYFYERSSVGKIITASTASSLYGSPDLLWLTQYGTVLGSANKATAHNDGLMPLDETGQSADPISAPQSAYALSNGVGKLQGTRDDENQDLKRWRMVAISTGETDLETFVATPGRKTEAGQLVRLLNIPLSKAVRFYDYRNEKQHVDTLEDAYQHHHGAPGRERIKWLADHQ